MGCCQSAQTLKANDPKVAVNQIGPAADDGAKKYHFAAAGDKN